MSTETATGGAVTADSFQCGKDAAKKAMDRFKPDGPANMAIVLAATKYKYQEVLRGVHEVIGDVPLIGCSTAGEFADELVSDEATVVMLIRSDKMRFATAVGKGLKGNPMGAVSQVFSQFRQSRGNAIQNFENRSVLMLPDGLAGKGETLVDYFALEAGLSTSIAGGGSGRWGCV